jgi:hypothetical protein
MAVDSQVCVGDAALTLTFSFRPPGVALKCIRDLYAIRSQTTYLEQEQP